VPEIPQTKIHAHPWKAPSLPGTSRQAPSDAASSRAPCPGGAAGTVAPADRGFVELSCLSNFSFLEGASHPEELVARAAELGYRAIGIADRNTLAGAVRAFVAARDRGVRLVVGARVEFEVPGGAEEDRDDHGVAIPRRKEDAMRSGDGSRVQPRLGAHQVEIILLPTDLASYGRLCRLLSRGRDRGAAARRGAESTGDDFRLLLHDLFAVPAAGIVAGPSATARISADPLPFHAGLQAIVIAPRGFACMEQWFLDALAGLRRMIDGDRLSLAVWRLGEADTALRVRQMVWLSREFDIPLVAVNDVHMHDPGRRPLQDLLTCVRHGCTITNAGRRLFPNAERHLRSPREMAALFADLEADARCAAKAPVGGAAGGEQVVNGAAGSEGVAIAEGAPGPLARARMIAERCAGFSLDQIRYRYPSEVVPGGSSAMEQLRRLVDEGAAVRYSAARDPAAGDPGGVPVEVRARLDHELALIDELGYAPYFLTVEDLVRFARSRGILCQGRGAAANSAVCFVLGVTAVDPARVDMLFERFMSRERNEPPDIDVDFEHERREEVIQYVYAKYGRDRAAIAAEVISYRGRSAIRDVGKALGLGLDAVEKLAGNIDWWHRNLGDAARDDNLRQLGFDPRDPTLRCLFDLAGELLGFPRHLSQHVGGFIITEGALCELVPVRHAAMADRTIIEWDKDDLDAMGLMKVDVLALGMLTAIRKAIDLVNEAGAAPPLEYHSIPAEDPRVYEMVCRADTIGVFQIESRAQMSMLPRLRPKCYYDLVIEVAIVRPGPIVGDMVHPYLRRRNGEEPIVYPNETIRRVLGRTLGVPLFQEQAMSLAVAAAGFTPGEADQLRRVIAAWKRMGSRLAEFGDKLINGMLDRGYERTFAEQVFRQIQGFSGYGFPESHAASFALIVYVSAWLKCHHPAAFAAALINSQPMGFYAPAQIISDAKEHGVTVREIDVNESAWDCTLEPGSARGTESLTPVSGATQPIGEPAPTEKSSGTVACRARDAAGIATSRVPRPALRLGLRLVSGLPREDADRVIDAVRRHGRFRSIEGLWRASAVPVGSLRRLARADAFRAMGFPRQQALWQIRRLRDEHVPLFMHAPGAVEAGMGAGEIGGESSVEMRRDGAEAPVPLPPVAPAVEVSMDYGSIGLSLKAHPMSFLRERLRAAGASPCRRVRQPRELPSGSIARIAGIVLVRQRPATAKGVVFMTIEDETGPANLILKPKIYAKFRRDARHSVIVLVEGRVERRNEVCHLLVRRLRGLDAWLAESESEFASQSRDFH